MEGVGSYASSVCRVGTASSSELREIEGTRGIEGEERGGMEIQGGINHVLGYPSNNDEEDDEETLRMFTPQVVYSSSSSDEEEEDSENMFDDETTMGVTTPTPGDLNGNADRTTLVIPPEEIQGSLREKGINSRTRTGIEVKMDENGHFLCPVCGHPYKRREWAVHHSYTHMNRGELGRTNIYHRICPHCPHKIFFHRELYACHINSILGIDNHTCQICKKGFSQKGLLQVHMLTHHVNEGSPQ